MNASEFLNAAIKACKINTTKATYADFMDLQDSFAGKSVVDTIQLDLFAARLQAEASANPALKALYDDFVEFVDRINLY